MAELKYGYFYPHPEDPDFAPLDYPQSKCVFYFKLKLNQRVDQFYKPTLHEHSETTTEQADGTKPIHLLTHFTLYESATRALVPFTDFVLYSHSTSNYSASGLVSPKYVDIEEEDDKEEDEEEGDGDSMIEDAEEWMRLPIIGFSAHHYSETTKQFDQ
jgi:hypothetical protein